VRRAGLALAGATVAGILLALSLPPWPFASGAWLLGVAGAGVLFRTLLDRRPAGRLAAGLVAGVAFYAPSIWWMAEFSVPGYAVAALLQAAILAAGTGLVPSAPGHPTWCPSLAFPAVLVLVEAARGAWPFGGLPVAGIDLGQAVGPFAAAARLGGRLAVVALVGAAGVGAALVVRRGQAEPVGWVVRPTGWRTGAGLLVLAVVAVVVAAALAAPDGSPAGRRVVAAVQGGGARGLRAVDTVGRTAFESSLKASERVGTPVDLVLWPEDVVDVERLARSPEDGQLARLARRLEATVVAGVVADVTPCPPPGGTVCRFTNAAVAWGPDGRRIDRSDKVHRVPFGEYVPFRDLFERLADLSDVPRDALAGRGPGTLDTPAGRVGVLISYEVFFGDRARAAAAGGGRLLLVPTNASSYRGAQVPAQQVAAARLRAVETGRWLVQAAPTGYTAFVDHRGRLRARGGLGRSEVLQRGAELRSGRTVATTTGPWPVLILAALALAIAKLRGIRTGSLMVDPGRRRDRRTRSQQEDRAC